MFSRGLLVLALCVLAIPGGAAASADDACAGTRARSDARAAVVTGAGARVSVIGDSYSVGVGLEDPADSWPAYLPGEVHVDGFSGSGFTRRASRCRGVEYAARATRALTGDPAVVVVEGGLNDFRSPTADIEAGARRLVAGLDGVRVVLVGPAMAPSRADQVARVDSALARVAASEGVEYISAKDWPLEYLPDRLHLTREGSLAFGTRVAAAVGDLAG